MKNKKGFTLIELLAVIVVLSIIALIAVPIILNVIDKAKQGSAIDGAYGYIDAVEKSVAIGNINQDKGITIPSDNELKLGDIDDTLILDKISVKGKKPDYIEMTFEKGKVKTAGFCVDDYNIEYKDKKVNISETDYCQFANVKSIKINGNGNQLQIGNNDNEYNLNLTGSNYEFNVLVTAKNGAVVPETKVKVDGSNDLKNNIIEVTKENDNFTIRPNSQGSTFIIIQAGIKYIKINVNVINDSLLGYLEQKTYNQRETYEDIIVKDVTYPAHVYYYEGNQVWGEYMRFGDDDDIGTASSYATRMVIVKVNGDLTINADGKIEPYYTEFGGPKGFLLYVTGTLTNNGTIDNSHGAYAEGQDVYLWQNGNNTYEYVPAVGAAGGVGGSKKYSVVFNGSPGESGNIYGRGTGGGGAGTGHASSNYTIGNGGSGTSYSGGAGSGSIDGCNSGTLSSGSGSSVGGSGGAAMSNGSACIAVGGVGNPSAGIINAGKNTKVYSYNSNGTGGLLIIYGNQVINNGSITANGSNSGSAAYTSINKTHGGGSSGGGSINIFYKSNITSTEDSIMANGGISAYGSGHGGAGSITIGSIAAGTFVNA